VGRSSDLRRRPAGGDFAKSGACVPHDDDEDDPWESWSRSYHPMTVRGCPRESLLARRVAHGSLSDLNA